jgi:hypothetical protein
MQVGSKKMPCGYHPISAEKKSDFVKRSHFAIGKKFMMTVLDGISARLPGTILLHPYWPGWEPRH